MCSAEDDNSRGIPAPNNLALVIDNRCGGRDMRKTKWWVGGAVILVACLAWLQFRAPKVTARVYRMGWTDSPPFEVRGADGQPAGLAVDLLRTAALRRGIRLQWVYWGRNSEVALRDKVVDLWPLMTVTPERLQHLYISEPYLEAEFCLLVRADSPYTKMQDLATGVISFANRPVDSWQLDGHLPHVRKLSREERSEVMEDLCQQRADAAFMNAFTGIATLLDTRGVCGEQALRWIATPEIRARLGIAAPFEFRATADALRQEIGVIAAEGKLAPILGQSGFMSQQLESMEALLEARRRGQRLAAAALLFGLLFVAACWQSVRFMREARRTRRTEKALRETEQKLRLMANNMKEMVLAYDMDRRLIFANPAVETLTGYRIADLEKDRFVNWIHPDDQARMLGYWDAIFQGGGYENEEYRLVTRDGRNKWVSATWGPIRDDAGTQIGVQGSERDITERRLADEALRESERRFRGLLEHVQLSAAIFDIHGNFVFVNDCLLATTGWTREEMMGRHTTEFLPPDQHERIYRRMESLAKTGVPAHWFSEMPFLTKDGKQRWVQMNSVALRDSEGNVAAVATLGADVTEHRALQEQYLQAQKLESVGRLAGGIAHDFNNLLTVINGYSNIILKQLSADDPLKGHAADVCHAGERAAALTQQLLAFSRKQAAQPQPLDLNALISGSKDMLRRLLGEDIRLETTLAPKLGLIMADSGQLHQVLMNLLVNARDAMPDGGELLIETSHVEVGESAGSDPRKISPGPYLLLAVTDNGSGMDEETQRHIFEPFFTTKPVGKGTGLGLPTVYGIVTQNQGWIETSSQLGCGTTFRIYLPQIRSATGTAVPGVAHHGVVRGFETVLVVEDQAGVRKLVSAVLASHGYKVLAAADGETAMAMVERHAGQIHLVLTDVVMPGMNGPDLVEELRRERPEMRAMFMSGYGEDVIAQRISLIPGAEHIAKPFTAESLVTRLRQSLDRVG